MHSLAESGYTAAEAKLQFTRFSGGAVGDRYSTVGTVHTYVTVHSPSAFLTVHHCKSNSLLIQLHCFSAMPLQLAPFTCLARNPRQCFSLPG